MNDPRSFVFLLIFGVAACGFIQKVPSTSYTEMSEEEREAIQHPPDSAFTFTEKAYENPEDMELYEIDKERLMDLMESPKTWIFLWTTSCPRLLYEMEEYCKVDSIVEDVEMVLVSANYDPELIRKYTYKAGYRKPLFVVDAKRYGEKEYPRREAFMEALSPEPLDSSSYLAQHFFFRGKEWVGRKPGRLSADTLDHYFR